MDPDCSWTFGFPFHSFTPHFSVVLHLPNAGILKCVFQQRFAEFKLYGSIISSNLKVSCFFTCAFAIARCSVHRPSSVVRRRRERLRPPSHLLPLSIYCATVLVHSEHFSWRNRQKEMTIFRVALRSLNGGLSHQFHQTHFLRSLSTWTTLGNGPNDQQTNNSSESAEEFEHRIFGETPGSNSKTDAFFEKLDRMGRARNRSNSRTEMLNDLDESFNTLTDGMDGKLKEAATYFEFDPEEVEEDGYAFRYDANYARDLTYDIKDLDLTKPAAQKLPKSDEFTVTTEEVLRKADFRNVQFLANFITEAGIIIKRSQTGISAKAQRKVAREIKTARAFGLMPFTTMGTKAFVFGKNMENLDEDYYAFES